MFKGEYWREINTLDVQLHKNAAKVNETKGSHSSGTWGRSPESPHEELFTYRWRGSRHGQIMAMGTLLIAREVRGEALDPRVVEYQMPMEGISFDYLYNPLLIGAWPIPLARSRTIFDAGGDSPSVFEAYIPIERGI